MLKNILLMSNVVLFIISCSANRTVIISDSLNNASLNTYYIENIKLGKTLAESSEISGKFDQLQDVLMVGLNNRGMSQTDKSQAGLKAVVIIETDYNAAVDPDEIRFMKGAHKNRSNFPDANPRVRNLESDYLKLILLTKDESKVVFDAKCRIIETQNAVDEKVKSILTVKDAVSCIEEIISRL